MILACGGVYEESTIQLKIVIRKASTLLILIILLLYGILDRKRSNCLLNCASHLFFPHPERNNQQTLKK
jgi:hypothetical protein